MKKIFYLFVALLISQNMFAANKFWVSTSSTDWNNSANWSLSAGGAGGAGVPTSSDYVYIQGGTVNPIISSGTTATVISVNLVLGSKTLTINSGGTLNIRGDGNYFNYIDIGSNATLINNGTIAMEASDGGPMAGIFSASYNNAVFTNNGTLRINSSNSSGNRAVEMNNAASTFNNNSCGKVIVSGTFTVFIGVVNNSGYIQTDIIENTGSFTNNSGGVVKYNSLVGGGSFTNSNGSVRVNNNPTNSTIFTYQGTFTGTVNGIYTNSAATTLAGTFTAPNTFIPSGLPAGSQTLYAKITPSGNACNYVVPFTYNNVPQRYYVRANATGTNNGTSWTNAFTSLQSALAIATSQDEIWVAAGTYKPHASSQSASFVIPSGLKIYGGFAGNETTLASRNIALINTTNQTTLSGDLSGNDVGFNNRGENSYRVVTFTNAVSTTTLDGFRILGANNIFGNITAGFGGGIYNNGSGSGNSSNPTISNCTITYCSAFLGGGMYNDGTNGGNASPTITNCIFISNQANDSGAGLANYGTSGNSSPTISRCSFIGNSATFNSGAINNHGESGISSPIITNCVFIGNYADNNGGVMVNTGFNSGTSAPIITNCSFSGNSAGNVGGVIRNNTANPVLKNSIIWGNSSLFDNNVGSVTATYCDIEGGYAGMGNINSNPLFTTQPAFASAPTTTGDLRLPANSPAVNAGTNTGAPTIDLLGNTRPFSGTPSDMGAYEFQGACSQIATAIETMTWNGLVSSDWNNPCNWTPNGVPSATNDVTIPLGRPNRANVLSGNAFAKSLNIADAITVSANASLTITNNLTGSPGVNVTMAINGTLTANGTANSLRGIRQSTGGDFSLVNIGVCGKFIMPNGSYEDGCPITNNGYLEINSYIPYVVSATQTTLGGALRNFGVVKSSAAIPSANITNNTGAVTIINNPTNTTIFNYTGTFAGTINGIFTNAAATTSAGTFTAPNTFTPSGLPNGSQTLYAKITPSGNTCSYVVPFTYTMASPPTLTAGAVTNATTCNGDGSIAFTTTNIPNGTYSLSFTPSGSITATTSPQNVTVTNNAFTLVVKRGTYNDFSMTVGGQTASTGTLTPAKVVSQPAPTFLPSSNGTNPSTCGGSNGSIPFTGNGIPDGTYSLSFNTTGATTSPQNITVSNNAFSLTGLKAGVYSSFQMTVLGCSSLSSFSRTLGDPPTPSLTVGTSVNPTTCAGTNGSIAFTTNNLSSGIYTLNYSKNGIATTATITASANAFTLTGLSAGTYTPFSLTANGCSTGSITTSKVLSDPAAPTLTVGTSVNPTTCSGTNGSIAFTTTNLANGNYTLNYSKNGIATTATITVSANAFTLTGLSAGTYTPFSITANGCSTGSITTSKVLSDPATPTLTVGTSVNPTTCAGTNGSIAFTTTNLANGNYTLNYNKNGIATSTTITVSTNAFTLTGLSAGTYTPFSITNNGCSTGSITTSKVLSDPATPTLTVGTSVNPTTCSGTNGSIAFTTTNLPNATYTLNYSKNGIATTATITVSANAFTLTGLSAGTYTPFSITNNGCSTGSITTSKVLSDPATPTLTVGTSVNPTTCAGTNGSIAFTTTNLPNATYTLNYSKNGIATTATITVSANAFTLTGLSAGTYTPFSITNNGCSTGSITTSKVLSDPATPTLTVGTSANPTTCSGTNGSITFTTTNLANGTYTLSYSKNGIATTTSINISANAFTLAGLTAGTYTPFSITNAGCTGSVATSIVLSDPVSPTISAGTVVNPVTCGATGSIPFTSTNLPNGTYSLSFTASGVGATTSPRNITVSNNTFSLTGLSVGSYSNFSLTRTGCVGNDATSKTIVNPTTPTLVAGTAVNPTSCGGNDGSISFTTNLPDGTYSLSYTGTGSPKSITVSGGAFNLGSLSSGAYSNFSITNNGCVGTASTSKSLSDPAAPVLTLGTTTNPSACNLSDGSIAFTTSNIADGTYSLTYSAVGASATAGPKSVTVSSNAFVLSGLSDGVYSNFSVTNLSGCTGSLGNSVTLVDLALPVLTVGASTNPTTCAGTQGTIAFTTANLPDGAYSLSFTSTGTTSPQNITVANNSFTLSGLSAGVYSNFSVTRLGCTGSVATSKTLIDPVAPTLTAGVSSNPSICAGTDGSIDFTTTNLANGTYSLSFTSTGTSSPKNVVVSNNTFLLSGLMAGNYSNFSLTNNGCTTTESTLKTLSDPPSISLSVGTSTNPTVCSGTDGSINFTTTNLPNGSYTLTYTGAGSPKTVTVNNNAFSISGLAAGAYSNFSITYLGCVGSDSQTKTLSDPASATLTAGTVSNPSTCNGSDGSITFSSTNLPNGTYSLSYTGTGSPQNVTVNSNTFTLTGLSAGNYSNFSLVSNGCTAIDASVKTLVAPSTPTLLAGTVTNPSTCSGSNGSIAFTTSLPNGTYSLAYTGANSPQNITVTNGAFTLTGLSAGVYSNFSIINNGCTATDETAKTLTDPNTPTLTAGAATNPSSCNGADGSIAFTTSFADGTYSLVYTGAGSPRNVTVANGVFTLTGLQDGVYANFSITNNGCVSLAATSKTLVDPAVPTLTAGTVTNPSVCNGADGKIAFTTSLPNGTYSLSYSGAGSPKNVTVVNGVFELTGLLSGTYSGFSVITNGCTGTDATTKTLTDPAAPTLTAGTVTNPTTCLSSDGKIAFTTSLANGTYTLNYTGIGSPKTVTVANGAFELTGLADGTFSGFSITVNGCTGTDATTKTLTDPAAPTLTAGTATNPSTCSSSDGSIAFTTSLSDGTYTLNYTGTGSPRSITVVNGAFTLTGLPDGTFSGFSVVTGGCTGTSSASIKLTAPTAPTLTAGAVTNPSSCNGTGSIAFTTTLPNGTYTINYTGSGSPKTITVVGGTFALSGLPSGDYSGFSITTGGCIGIDNSTKTIVNPNSPTLTVGAATNPSTCSGTGSIAFTTNLPDGIYNLTYTGTGSPQSVTVTNGAFVLSSLLAGTYSNFSIDNNNGCLGIDATSKTLSDPTTPTIIAGDVTNPTLCSGSDGSIAFTTNLPNGNYSLSFTGNGSPKTVTVTNGNFNLTGLSAGTYSNFSVTNNGCVGSDATIKSLTDPLAPSVLITGNDNLNCSTTSVIRTASGGSSYSWSNGLGTNATATITAAGIYTVTVTLNGCTATATTDVTFTNNLVASASNSGPYRVGNTIELNASGGSNYVWSGPNSFTSTSQNPSISNALVANAGVYTVTISTGLCSATATTNVIIDALIDPCIPIIDYQFVKAGNPYQPLFNLTNGMVINQISDPVSIIAVPICPTITIESLVMKLQGPNMNEEILQNVSPYAIFDNTGNSINGRILAPGVYTLTITGYNQDNMLGGINYGPVVTTFTILPNIASIATPTVSKTVICGGSNLDVSFSINGIFNPTNQFRVELSDANGNFGSIALLGNIGGSATFTYPTIIGTSSSAGVITCSIPSTLDGGTNYRIRVVSTDGVSVSQANSNSITIHPRDLNLVSPTDDYSTNIGTKQASNKVTASNKISATANVNYQAGKAIILNAGFEANAGTVFKAEIRGCEN